MGLDIAVTVEEFLGNEDRRWLGTRLGTDQCRSITLDASAFSDYHLTAKGAVPSGTALGKIEATGLYGPYDEDANDGTEVAAGLLFSTTKIGKGDGSDLATAANVGAALYWMGVVKTAFLPTADETFGDAGNTDGVLDEDGMADLSNFIRFEES